MYAASGYTSHATRCYSGETLASVYPPTEREPTPIDEIAVAYGRRHVPKLVDVIALPELEGEKRAKALRYLRKLLSNQETKAEAVTYGSAPPVITLTADADADVRREACMVLEALCLLREGRKAVVEGEGVTALTTLLTDGEEPVRDAAAAALSTLSTSSDGAAYTLGSPAGVVPAVVAMLGDAASSATAKMSGVETLAHVTLTDPGVEAALRAHVPAAVLPLAQGAADGLMAAVCLALKNMCQHPYGKVQSLEAGALPVLKRGLTCADEAVRLQAAGALLGMALEMDAKLPVASECAQQLIDLLHDANPAIAENALMTIQNSSESPEARYIFSDKMQEAERDLVFSTAV
mmetsp:Transcript_22488/g.76422  ORF Transcript_22488/g.76422 Transcript_22488/m.76422 type:complete len:350 (-) Transcript_22488:750-1799(-)